MLDELKAVWRWLDSHLFRIGMCGIVAQLVIGVLTTGDGNAATLMVWTLGMFAVCFGAGSEWRRSWDSLAAASRRRRRYGARG